MAKKSFCGQTSFLLPVTLTIFFLASPAFTNIFTLSPEQVSVIPSSEYDTSVHNAQKLIDRSGIWNDGMYHDNSHPNMWISAIDYDPAAERSLTFVFDDLYNVEVLHIWNGNQIGYTDRALRHISIEYSIDGIQWTVFNPDYQCPEAPGISTYSGHSITLEGIVAKYVRLSAHPITTGADSGSWGHSTQVAVSEVEFQVSQNIASVPNPADNSFSPNLNVTFTWESAVTATSHDFYLGTDYDAVNSASRAQGDIDGNGKVDIEDLSLITEQWLFNNPQTNAFGPDIDENGYINLLDLALLGENWNQKVPNQFQANLQQSSYTALALEPNTTYYWRVDEIIDTTVWKGPVWTFTTPKSLYAFCGTGDHLWVASKEPVDSPETIDAMLEWMADTYNINRIYWRGGQEGIWQDHFRFGQETLSQYDYTLWAQHLYKDIDLNTAAVEAARRHGMEIFLYTGLFEHGVQPDVGIISPYLIEDTLRISNPQWCPLDRWLERRCPGPISFCYPEARTAIIDRLVNEIVSHDYDGVNFYTYVENTGIRYEDEFGFNPPIEYEFNKMYPGVNLRTDTLTPAQKEYWYKCRGKFVTDFLTELHQQLCQYDKKLSIILDANEPNYPQPWWGKTIRGTGKILFEWETWIENGIVDEIWVQLASTVEQQALLDRLIEKCQGTDIELTVRTADPLGTTWQPYVEKGVTPVAVITWENNNGIEKYSLEPIDNTSLTSSDWKVRLQALKNVVENTLSVSASEVAPLITDSNVLVRRMAVKALAAIGDTAYVSYVENALNDCQSSVRIAAASALASFSGSYSTSAIFSTLEQDTYFQFKNACISSLASFASIAEISDYLTSPSETIREVCIRALYTLGRANSAIVPEIYPLLRATAIDPSETKEIRYRAIESLTNLRIQLTATQRLEFINDVIDIVENESSPLVQLRSAYALEILSSYMNSSQKYAAINNLKKAFEQYGTGTSSPDAAYGWRVVGNALRAFGSDGENILKTFLFGYVSPSSSYLTATANHYVNANYSPQFCVNSAGLDSSGLLHRNNLSANVWLANSGSGDPHPGTVPGATWIKIDLGFTFNIDSLWIWNIASNPEAGLKNITIQYSQTGTPDSWQTAWVGTLNQSAGTDYYSHESEIQFNTISARYIVITSDIDEGNYGQEPSGLAEIRFNIQNDPWLAWNAYEVLYKIQENTKGVDDGFCLVDESTDIANHNSYAPPFPGYRNW